MHHVLILLHVATCEMLMQMYVVVTDAAICCVAAHVCGTNSDHLVADHVLGFEHIFSMCDGMCYCMDLHQAICSLQHHMMCVRFLTCLFTFQHPGSILQTQGACAVEVISGLAPKTGCLCLSLLLVSKAETFSESEYLAYRTDTGTSLESVCISEAEICQTCHPRSGQILQHIQASIEEDQLDDDGS